jgi:hypothetical protein
MAFATFWSLERAVRNILEFRTWRSQHFGVLNMAFATYWSLEHGVRNIPGQAWDHHGPWSAQGWAHNGPWASLGPSWAIGGGREIGPIMGPGQALSHHGP